MEVFSSRRTWVLLLLTIIIASSVFILDSFRDDDFCRYDSSFYSTISQNIIRTGNWIDLQYATGKPFEGDHPPLVFWAVALFMKIFGESVFSAVFFSLLCGTLTCAVVFFIGTMLKNDIVGFLSGMGLLLTRYVTRVARHNTLEIPLMLFVALAVLFLILALKKHKAYYILFGVSVGFAVLTKGVVGLFPLGICFFALIFEKRLKDMITPFFLIGILAFLILPGSWIFIKSGGTVHGAIEVLLPYFKFVGRTFTGTARENPGSRLRFVTRLFEFCFIIMPGVVLGLYFICKEAYKEKKKEMLVLPVWALIFIVGFMLSSWRRGFYLLPMYPSMALMFGIGIYEIIPKNHSMTAVYLVISFFMGNISAPFLFPHWEPKSVGEVVLKNTYLPGARKAVDAIIAQMPGKTRFIGYQPGGSEEYEFIYFFKDYNISLCKNIRELEELAYSKDPVIFYISKEDFSHLGQEMHKHLKIVYSFDDQLLVTNNMGTVPVFDKAD